MLKEILSPVLRTSKSDPVLSIFSRSVVPSLCDLQMFNPWRKRKGIVKFRILAHGFAGNAERVANELPQSRTPIGRLPGWRY